MINLSAIRIVLVGTTHAGNIGSAARAMKTMGLHDLVLVAPEAKFPCGEATALAAGADDILTQARVVNDISEAIADCHWVMGTSARQRHMPVTLFNPREAATYIATRNSEEKIAILFGREHSGLTNEELLRCHYHIHIPSMPEFSSLNLAASVQILSYELRMLSLEQTIDPPRLPHDTLATQHEMELFYTQLEASLKELDFLKDNSPRQMLPRLRRLFHRAHVEKMEFDLLIGIFKALQKQALVLKKRYQSE